MSKRHWWYLDPGGSLLGLALAVASVTPSLLPRPALLQGAVAAVAFGLGYLVGVGVWAVLSRLVPRRPRRETQRLLWIGYAGLWLLALSAMSVLAVEWQNKVRRLVEMGPLDGAAFVQFVGGFVPLTVGLLAIGKGTRRVQQALAGRTGQLIGTLGTLALLVALLAGLMLAAVSVVNAIYADRNAHPDAGLTQPDSAYRSAGPSSSIAWHTLGRHGADFVAGGPSAAQIKTVTGSDAIEPVRVYAGLASASTSGERARLVVEELERTGGFTRKVLVVATTTGSGWLEPQTVDAIEYLHAGDTAIASMQYAYTPSWVSFLFEPNVPVEAATTLFEAVHNRWSQLPADRRPLLVTYGLSLGAHGSQAVFADVADIRDRTGGAMFVGSPNGSPLWRSLQAARDAGSPAWQPVLDDGREVRWMSQPGDASRIGAEWTTPRVLYLQHATDPVTWLGPELLWRSPDWLEPGQRAADVSPSMRWIPVVTGVQVAIDMLMGESVPARHGHNYGDVVTAGWRAVTGDANLTPESLAQITRTIEQYADLRPFAD